MTYIKNGDRMNEEQKCLECGKKLNHNALCSSCWVDLREVSYLKGQVKSLNNTINKYDSFLNKLKDEGLIK